MKRIGVLVSAISAAENKIELSGSYAQFIGHFGLPIPINALDPLVHTDLDMLILPGGADVNPARYNQPPSFMCQNPNIQMEWWDTVMLPKYIAAGMPIFGICRGFQTLNVHAGGSLVQHQFMAYSTPRTEKVDKLLPYVNANQFLEQKGIGYKIPAKDFKVNSLHHQCVSEKGLGAGITPLAFHDTYGYNIVEAFAFNDAPIFAVQWHPEEIWDNLSQAIMRRLLTIKPKV